VLTGGKGGRYWVWVEYRLRNNKLAKKTAKKKVAKKTAKKRTPKKATKKAVKKTVKKTPKKVVKKTVKKKIAKKAVKKTVKKKAAKKAVKKAVKKTAKKAVKKASAGIVVKPQKKKKLKTHLTKKQLKEFKGMLLEKRRSLLGDMSGMEGNSLGKNMQESSGDLSNMPTHPADIGSDNFEHEFTLGLLESERALLVEINEALDRIVDNSFGVCPGTGKPIGLPRLRARPWCKYGIEYQRMIEKGLVKPGDDDEY
jgi:DnaK suppressor protein